LLGALLVLGVLNIDFPVESITDKEPVFVKVAVLPV
jgi:hypothetical protein